MRGITWNLLWLIIEISPVSSAKLWPCLRYLRRNENFSKNIVTSSMKIGKKFSLKSLLRLCINSTPCLTHHYSPYIFRLAWLVLKQSSVSKRPHKSRSKDLFQAHLRKDSLLLLNHHLMERRVLQALLIDEVPFKARSVLFVAQDSKK